MKIILNKTLPVTIATAYLKLEKETKRLDIQQFLQDQNSIKDPIVRNRIREYLKTLGLLTDDGSLSSKGNKAKNSALVNIKEEGKYKVAFIDNDMVLGNRIIELQRENTQNATKEFKQFNNFKDRVWNAIESENYSLTHNNAYIEIKNKDKINITWQSETPFEKDELSYEKELLRSKNKQSKSKKISDESLIDAYISEIIPDYDREDGRLKVYFDNVQHNDQKSRFIANHWNKCRAWNGYSIKLQDIALKPYDLENATKWRDYLVAEELKKNYCSNDEFKNVVSDIEDKDAFSEFKQAFGKLTSDDFAKEYHKEKVIFWHLTAPQDLNPNEKIFENTLSIQEGELYSYQEIVNDLIDSYITYKLVTYYDRYILRDIQQQKALAFMDCFDSKNKTIITNKKESYKNFSQSNQVKVMDLPTKPPHDRYLILEKENGDMICFTMTNSLDYLHFNKNTNITSKQTTTVKQTVTFSKIGIQNLPENIKNLVKGK
ncbi:hypothetical protein QJU89_02445 [Pasteurella skyensis]|uniref:Uncharacterized protein n=1 Tax=Phocoenobacter skyensis TaxID=97481 RepID=A0AAJ6N8T6_9PAST|nr:hypothetical protein [Pasteurella skyensis]MDP8162366.1 hypothetical protein [Pasteurella skyensis]MDP8172300.1 hypothetical protein [Pasteurella skyensis]MDP8178555.1 hypothetical protein [Pasteurella skyensis]MDP8182557.1 hypothetical protein [Pasteurella skyensis]MDP8188862.1 hypothetical protein [Pasteurella skyensis]